MNNVLKSLVLVAIMSLLATLTATGVGATHGGSASPELNVVSNLDLGVPGENITDVWAYGNYAYLGTFDDGACSLDYTGVHIVDISDPANPAKVGFIPAQPGTRNNDVKVEHIDTPKFHGEILVVSNESCGSAFQPRLNSNGSAGIPGQGGISIWDVTNPAKPRALKQNFIKNATHNTFIWQDGSNAYLIAVDDIALRDVIIVDITKPQSPRVIKRTGGPDWPDLDFSEIEGAGVFLHDVWVQDGIAYLSYWDAGLVMLDVSDPANPVFLGDSTYPVPDSLTGLPPAGNGHVAAPTADGDIVILGDEDFSKFDTVLSTSAGNFQIGIALFGPDPVTNFPGGGDIIDAGSNGCTAASIPAATGAGQIALIERGACFFSSKAASAQAQGYEAYIVYNSAAGGNALINMSSGTADVITIPGVFVGRDDGLSMQPTATNNGIISLFNGEGYLRMLDVTDPANMVQLGHFATEGVFSLGIIPGDRTVHNVIVDDGMVYVSWYAEGMRVVDFSSCTAGDGHESCVPTEAAHFVDTVNGSNFWGVYLHTLPNGDTYILGSDRSTGLWIFDTP